MTGNLHWLDIVIGIGYLAATTILALFLASRQKDLRSYFVGDRNVPWWLILTSIVATETSTVTFLSVPGVAFNPEGGNLSFLQLAFGFALGRVFVAIVLLPQFMRGDLFSVYQLLNERFNRAVQRTASGLFLFTRTIADGLRLYLTALVLKEVTGWDIAYSVLAMGAATIFYTYMGGMKAVIWTDLLQFAIYILGGLLAGYYILQYLPGGWHDFWAVGSEAGKFQLFNFSTDPTITFTLWTGVIGGAFFSMASHGADQMMVQRYLCARSLGEARLAVISSGLVVILQFTLFLLIGVGLYVLFRQGIIPTPERNDQVFAWFIIHRLPTGVVGLVLAGVLSAAMSTLSSSLNSSANAFVSDFYQPFQPAAEESHYLHVSRWMTLFWGAVQMGVALVASAWLQDESVINQVFTVAGFTTGMILGLFLLGGFHQGITSKSASIGMLAGFTVVSAVWLFSIRGLPILAWPWYAPLGALVTLLVGWFVAKLR